MMRRVAAAATVAALTVAGISGQQAAASRTTNDAVFSEKQATRGGVLYQQHCAMCHGPALAGIEMAPALTGPEFNANWGEVPLGDLFERIRISMPQDKPGNLSLRQNADILAFVLKFNGAPAGLVELPADAEALKQIRIVPALPPL